MILVTGANGLAPEERMRALLAAGIPQNVADALDVQAHERTKGATGESVVHPETRIALDIRPTTFAEFARRYAAQLSGETTSSQPRVA